MGAVTGAIVGSAVIGGLASRDAAKRQARAANNATAMQQSQYEQQREDSAPWREAGQRALLGMEEKENFQKDFTMADFQKDPGYDFRMQEGMKAINNSAAARGMGNSGATLKSLAKYGQDFASNEYTNAYNRFNSDRDRRFNRLSSLAGVGQTANSQLAQAGSNYANQAGQNMMAGANARAAGTMAMANNLSGAIGQGLGYYQNYQMMNQMFPPKTPTKTPTDVGM